MTMSAPVRSDTTLAEFLAWAPPDDRRYELIDGRITAMNAPSGAHTFISANLVRHVGNHLESRPGCSVRSDAGIVPNSGRATYFQADVAVTCTHHRRGEQAVPDPILIIEVLSPSTGEHDREVKLPAYRAVGSVREIVLVSQDRAYAEVHRRHDGSMWIVDLALGLDAVLRLDSISLDLPLAEIYRGVDLEPSPPERAAQGNG